MTDALKPWLPRAARFEAILALVTAASLVAHGLRWGHGPIGIVSSLTWGLATALVVGSRGRGAWRVWRRR